MRREVFRDARILPFFVRVFVPPLPVLLLLRWFRFIKHVNLDVLLIEEEVIGFSLVFVPLMVILVGFVVVTFTLLVVSDD